MQTSQHIWSIRRWWVILLALACFLVGCGSGKSIRVQDVYGDPVVGAKITVGSLTRDDITTRTNRKGVAPIIDTNITHPSWISIRKRGYGSMSIKYTNNWPKLVTLRGYD